MPLTGDGHVHSEWSWDTGGPRSAAAGRMEAMCRRALKIGLPALAFTEHLDLTGWVIDPEDLLDHLRALVDDNGLLIPEPLDVAGYLESVERCRQQFLELRILSGVEFGQPHIDADKARQLVDLSALDRVWVAAYAADLGGIRRAPLRADHPISAVAGGTGDPGVFGRGPANDRRLGRVRSVVAHRLRGALLAGSAGRSVQPTDL